MLLLWSSYIALPIIQSGGSGFHGTYEGLGITGLERKLELQEKRRDDEEILMMYQAMISSEDY